MDILKKLTMLEHEASDFGFKWETSEQIMSQIKSECSEVEVHLEDKNQNKLQEELGDLMHAVFSLCVFCDLDPNETLKASVDKFERRFKTVKELALREDLNTLNGKSFDELMRFWDAAKRITG